MLPTPKKPSEVLSEVMNEFVTMDDEKLLHEGSPWLYSALKSYAVSLLLEAKGRMPKELPTMGDMTSVLFPAAQQGINGFNDALSDANEVLDQLITEVEQS